MTNPPQMPRPGVPLPQGPPSPPNRALWWVLGVILGLLLLIIGGGFYLAMHLVHNVTVKGPNQVEVSTAAGNLSVNKTTRNDTGLPVYPGAALQPEGASIQFEPLHEEGGLGLAVASYLTPDSLDQVAAWYRKSLDPSFQERRGKETATINLHGADLGHADLAFVSKQEDRLRVVALKHLGNQTRIALVLMGKRQPQ